MTRTALYRHYDAAGRLAYVGITANLEARNNAHKVQSAWFGDVAFTKVEWLDCREHAAALERVAIQFEKPMHNVANANVVQESAEEASAELLAEICAFAVRRGIAPATVTSRAVGNSRLYHRLASGKSCTLVIAAKVRAWMADETARSAPHYPVGPVLSVGAGV